MLRGKKGEAFREEALLGLTVRMRSMEPEGTAHTFGSMITRLRAHPPDEQETGREQEVGRGFKPKALPLAANFFT